MSPTRDLLRIALGLALLATGVARALTGDSFDLEVLAEICVFALAALSFDILAGPLRLVSMGTGLFVGLGAYATALLTGDALGLPPVFAPLPALALGAFAGGLVGFATARTRDLFYIMTTLAFGQMAYAFAVRTPAVGGDDGIAGIPRPDLAALGVDLLDGRSFALASVFLVALVWLLLERLRASGFGRALEAVGANERRARALGIAPVRLKVAAGALSGALAALAGVLSAWHAMFVSPQLFHWTWSGEVLTMAILGGIGTLVGPVLGAALVVSLKYALSAWTEHWGLVLGLCLVLAVWAGGRGLWGALDLARRRLAARTGAAGYGRTRGDAAGGA